MADSDKLTALKKAYADILLNTSKEAAARVLVAERKAQRYHRELFAAKDDALRMLLRLKQMLDSKVSEAETAALSQQQKIEELEAQLGEAEDIVKDLREELRELQDELEMAMHNQNNPLDEQYTVGDIATGARVLDQKISGVFAATQATAVSEQRFLMNSGTVTSSSPGAQCGSVTTKNSSLNGLCASDKCHSENGDRGVNRFVYSPDFTSMIISNNELEPYRNGCTHRIRAFERNLLDGGMTLSGKVVDAKNQISIGEDEDGKHACKNPNVLSDNTCSIESGSNTVKVIQMDGSYIRDRPLVGRHRRKRATRQRKCEPSVISSNESIVTDSWSEEGYCPPENVAQEDPITPVTPKSPSVESEMIIQPGPLEAATIQNTTNGYNLHTDELELSREQTRLQATEVLPAGTPNNKFLYTFHRKRRKDFLSSPDGDSSVENGSLERKSRDEEQNGSMESEKSTLITESSRSSRKLTQVARQLIPSSEKNQM